MGSLDFSVGAWFAPSFSLCFACPRNRGWIRPTLV